MEELADGRVCVREEEGGQLVVVRARGALERHQLRQERLWFDRGGLRASKASECAWGWVYMGLG